MEALQQSIVQVAGNSRSLADAGLHRHLELAMQLPDAQPVGRPYPSQQDGRAHGAEQNRIPPGRRDQNLQRHPLFIPYAIAV